jgi:hypothetical protein
MYLIVDRRPYLYSHLLNLHYLVGIYSKKNSISDDSKPEYAPTSGSNQDEANRAFSPHSIAEDYTN